ncbi:MAG: NmrA/HSCARG family protein [Chloroflexi bacterium]|nr:NmrA/HSCARG family protein [Chloroflexota bacterium]
MTNPARTILVIGATGNQGGGLVGHLLSSKDWHVRGLTRSPQGEKAQALAARGVEIIEGDMDDVVSIDAAMEGAYGVFSVQSQAAEDDPQLEMRQGVAVADAAVRAGVSHLVYTASCGAKEPDRGVSYWDAKRDIMAHIRQLGIRYTILRPVSFAENYLYDRAGIDNGVIRGMLTPEKTLQVISGHDIGAFAAAAFNNPDTYAGQEIDIAAETLTMNDIAAALGRVVGHDVRYEQIPVEDWPRVAPPQTIAMTKWYQACGYDEDIPALKARWGIPTLTFEEWLRAIALR